MNLVPLDLDRDLDLLHSWVTHPRSHYWGLQGADHERVRAEYQKIADNPHHHAWLGLDDDGTPLFLAETYEPAHSELAAFYDVRAGDLGMHVLVAPPSSDDRKRSGLTSAVFRAVMDFCFADPRVSRVVVEPDVRNEAIARKNAEAGFVEERHIQLHDKVARLSFCTRAAYEMSVPHLNPATIELAHRRLIAKALGEFAHERLIAPVAEGGGYRFADWTFRAKRLPMEHWIVDPASLEGPLDALDFISGLRETLGIPQQLLGTYLEEISATLAGTAWKLTHRRETADELVHADFQTIEAAMTEGHPGFVANNGRIGFGLKDHEAFAPEAGAPVRLRWVAILKSESIFVLSEDERSFYADELGAEQLEYFERRLSSLGLNPEIYRYLPVHPWQWEHKLAITFAPEIARRAIVPLDESNDRYRAQQSIRTFFNVDRQDRHYVKTAIAVQNMGFLRGLSPKYMQATPPINEWVADVVNNDEELRACRFEVLRELAAIGYTGDAYHRVGTPSAYTKMLAALWRESPIPRLAENERLATMASLVHRDRDGNALVTALIRESGVSPAEWVATYFRAYLRPIVHCLLQHDLAFMPHGENLILVLENHVPTRVFMKDIGEEVAVMNDQPLPGEVERIRMITTVELKELALFTDVFDGFLRHLAGILDADGVLPWPDFWSLAGDCVREHAKDHPAIAGRLDLFRPAFAHSCLNRLQLRNTLQMVDLADQESSLIYAGELENPIAS
ncbi:hypothetical protein ACTI_07770 [Actinoplanes sp. OR16]|uniref:GNAT family N-acetyltransferase n=1 Tax=Actinoplanes sp. OR16 TaxID=946334 RepID=UPI000F6FB583|nr:GNAT family N-acetyltransferase [Actinoplanes sp. OR16]BBH64092.1 hypothetical protein ACTI_07770 [Actinoplanes sp. OR16]